MTQQQLEDVKKNNAINMVPNPYDMVNQMREEREAAEKDGSIKKA